MPVMMGANRQDGSFAFEEIYDTFLKDKVDDEEWMRNELLPQLFKTMSESYVLLSYKFNTHYKL